MTVLRHASRESMHPNLEVEIARDLQADILDGIWKPGDRLVELDLAERYKVSQGTVRAALKYLQANGLVQHRPRRGNFVIDVTKEDINEISVLRDTLESLGARLAAQAIDDAGRTALIAVFEDMRRAAKSGRRKRLVELDLAFHRTVIEISGNRRLREIYRQLESQALLFLRMADAFYPEAEEIIDLHVPLLEAICRGDAETAFALAQRHSDLDAVRIAHSKSAGADQEADGPRLPARQPRRV
ncbi:GntR family transcriptional regulator [Pseudaminobacter sp. 19-2017]|uniref:GntR family transcriptional regulator n=1 Tax=Pseudaminobacter soli (ex Zhang et al. 2022) TaxID=2831468 RepID=A0A942E893_9HYPH|nr:GntR family transcriptional regulator [Pseudaminobacter soli]MBS3652245.1 GntR family transcriptional regulator [Pseudaminobacter soli]